MPAHVIVLAKEENVLVPHVGEIVIGLIAFGLLCAVLMRYVFPRIEVAYQERREAIEGGLQRAAEEQAKAHAAYEQYTAALAEAHQEAARFREEARADAARIREEAHAEAQAESARLIAAAEGKLTAERASIVADLRREIGGLAVDLAGKLVGQSLASDAAQQRLVDEFIADLDAQDPAPGLEPQGAGQH
jgi:F-type H+-transporting ATPase subunit b